MRERAWTAPREAGPAWALVRTLQARLVERLEALPGASAFVPVGWLRDGGRHGGGERFEAPAGGLFNRASANVSEVHYDDEPTRALASATALSAIVHPDAPAAPSLHLHVSYTALRAAGGSGWRVMADLNPSTPYQPDRAAFAAALTAAAPELAAAAFAEGDRYFFIPALGRHRGVCHFYLEALASDHAADVAARVAEAAIDTYAGLVAAALGRPPGDAAAQRAYHTVYLFQVLTLDRGTTAGLLVHDQNDLGVLASLPAVVDVALLASWRKRVAPAVAPLVDALVAAIPDGVVDAPAKLRLAAAVRTFYRAHPEARALQAPGVGLAGGHR